MCREFTLRLVDRVEFDLTAQGRVVSCHVTIMLEHRLMWFFLFWFFYFVFLRVIEEGEEDGVHPFQLSENSFSMRRHR